MIIMVNPIPTHSILKQLWIGECTIFEYQQVTDTNTHQTKNKLVPVVENEPCRLSYSTEQVTELSTGVASVNQEIKLFIRPDINIKAGSKIQVTQHGRTNKYKRVSEPLIYTNHQEVVLELDKEV